MPHRNELGLDWWRHTVEIVPHAAALVSDDNRFLFCNRAWCELVERSEADLRDKTWMDITPVEDRADDASEADAIRHGTKSDYYDSKQYLMPSGVKKPVGIWVNRHPSFGEFKGFVVFAKPRDAGATASDVQRMFESVRGQIAILEEQGRSFSKLERRMDISEALNARQNEEINHRFDRLEAAINRPPTLSVGGDYTGHDQDRSRNTNTNIAIIALVVLGAIAVVILFGGMLHLTGGGRAVIEQGTR